MDLLAFNKYGLLASLGVSLAACGSGGSRTADAGSDAMLGDATGSETSSDAGGADVVITDGASSTGSWETLEPMPEPGRYYVGVAAARGKVFVIGGAAAPQITVAQAYDTQTKTWATLETLPSPFQMPNVAAVGDRLFVVGGLRTTEVLEYDTMGHWVSRAPMPLTGGRGCAGVGVWGTKILIAGGVTPGLSANMLATGMRMVDVAAYDTATDTWQMLAPLAEANGYSMGAVFGDKFWVLGGSTNNARTNAVHVLDLIANTWSVGPALEQTLSSAAIAAVGDRILLIGGIASQSGTLSPETLVYSRDVGTVGDLATMPNPRFGSNAAVVNGRVYVAGGVVMASMTDYHAVTTFDVFTP